MQIPAADERWAAIEALPAWQGFLLVVGAGPEAIDRRAERVDGE
jgi:hypothetical protein